MAKELSYRAEAAAEYDRAFAHVSTHFVPSLLRAARLAPGMRVLDIATSTGLAAEPALSLGRAATLRPPTVPLNGREGAGTLWQCTERLGLGRGWAGAFVRGR